MNKHPGSGMNLSSILLSLREIGSLVRSENDLSFGSHLLKEYYTCETKHTNLSLVHIKDKPLIVPTRAKKGSGPNCNVYDETANFVFGIRDGVQEHFINQCLTNLKDAGEANAFEAVKNFFESLKQYEFVLVFNKPNGDSFYKIIRKGDPKPTPKKVNRKNMESEGVIADGLFIILTFNGTPLSHLPKVRNMWQGEKEEKPTSIDILTGKPCVPARLHVRVGALDAPLISFNSDAYAFDGYKQGYNFPVAEDTQRDFSEGMQRVASEQSMLVKEGKLTNLKIGWWAEGTLEHPLVKLLPAIFQRFRGKTEDIPKVTEEIAKVWQSLASLELDDHPIRFMIWRGAKSRFALIEEWIVSAKDLQKNLLVFHEEWKEIGFDGVLFVLTASYAEGREPIPANLMAPTLRAITTGQPYPQPILSYYLKFSHNWASYGSTWVKSYITRQFGGSMFPLLTIDQKKDIYKHGDEEPLLETYVGHTRSSLVGNKKALASFDYGLLLALYAKIKHTFHLGKNDKSIDVMDTLSRFRSPSRFLRQGVHEMNIYIGWCVENYNGPIVSRLINYMDQLLQQVDLVEFSKVTNTSEAYCGFGWLQGNVFFRELSRWNNAQDKTKDPVNKDNLKLIESSESV